MKLADRLSKIEEPQTIRMAKLSRELKAQGKDIIDLSLGEPDFKTPDHIVEAAIKAMQEGYTKYPPVAGFLDLKQAIVDKFQRENNLSYATDEVMVSTGAKQCIYNAVMSIVNDGDEVLIPSPFWVTYADIVKLSEGTVVQLFGSFENDFKITPAQLRNAITSKTKLFMFSSPCNPTGSIYSFEELKALVDVFMDYPQVYILSDEIYEHINFEATHESIAQFGEIKDRVIVINGLSKAFAITGWRLGYMAAHKDIIKACEKIQSQSTSGPNSITQRAAIAALNGDMQPTKMMCAAFKERRDYLVHALQEIKGMKVNNPPGAFYVFPDISAFIGKNDIHTAEDLCMYLLDKAQVSCVTGDAFGNPHCIRISYATSMEKLQEAVKRIRIALEDLG
ncbi:MAG: pyridoxal phosphate-dependent aminotransferase [Bacteroidetes bacterium]|nr:pyridoxal phosphate-dependent aminotransferase [Bacteroidota bacterium]